MTDLHYLVLSALLTWIMLITGATLRTGGLGRAGLDLAFGNREGLDAPAGIAGRADRAAKNMLENLLLFATVVIAARAAGVPVTTLSPAAALFFWARVLYFGLYLAGVKYLRTAIWFVGVIGIGLIGLAAFRAA